MGKKKRDASKSDDSGGAKAPKPATHVNVRHILCEKHSKVQVQALRLALLRLIPFDHTSTICNPMMQWLSSVHRQIMEALGKIQAGEQFSQVCCIHVGGCIDRAVRAVLMQTALMVCAQVACQMSEDKARQGGALGWKTQQDVVGAFADAAFKLGVSIACAAAGTVEMR
jgi:hypothetical protein